MKLFAVNTTRGSKLFSFAGEIVSANGKEITIDAIDGLMFCAGFWSESGNQYSISVSECEVFSDRDLAARRIEQITA